MFCSFITVNKRFVKKMLSKRRRRPLGRRRIGEQFQEMLPRGRQFVTLEDAGTYIMKLPTSTGRAYASFSFENSILTSRPRFEGRLDPAVGNWNKMAGRQTLVL
jgi:hypothetical protein